MAKLVAIHAIKSKWEGKTILTMPGGFLDLDDEQASKAIERGIARLPTKEELGEAAIPELKTEAALDKLVAAGQDADAQITIDEALAALSADAAEEAAEDLGLTNPSTGLKPKHVGRGRFVVVNENGDVVSGADQKFANLGEAEAWISSTDSILE